MSICRRQGALVPGRADKDWSLFENFTMDSNDNTSLSQDNGSTFEVDPRLLDLLKLDVPDQDPTLATTRAETTQKPSWLPPPSSTLQPPTVSPAAVAGIFHDIAPPSTIHDVINTRKDVNSQKAGDQDTSSVSPAALRTLPLQCLHGPQSLGIRKTI